MSNLNTILNKLGKIEEIHETNLGKHEIELALFDDIKNSIENARKLKAEILSNFGKANGGMRYCEAFDKSFSKALTMAKEVGFNVPQEVMKLQEMNNELRSFFTKIKALDQ